MSDKIKLVAGDTRPQLVLAVTDDFTKLPIDLSNPATTIALKFRKVGSSTVKDTMTCGKLAGLLNADGTISYAAPYNVPGAGGRAFMDWSPTALDTEGEYEGEIEITYPDSTVQTIFDTLKFKVRSQV